MKALLIGGTGAIGTDLAQILCIQGWEVHVTSRSKRSDSSNITYLTGDASNLIVLNKILSAEWDLIVDFMVYTTKTFESRFRLLLSKTRHYIYLSSARVYAESDEPITEASARLLDVCKDHIYLNTDEYALSKARQEDLLINSGLSNWTIVRPYITYGTHRLQLGLMEKEEWLYRAIQGRSIVVFSDINQRMTTMTSATDVSEAISKLCGCQNAMGEIFQIMNDNAIQWKEVLVTYQSVLNDYLDGKCDFIEIPGSEVTAMISNIYQYKYDRIYNRIFDASKIRAFTSKTNFHPPAIGLEKCLRAFLKNIHFHKINWRLESQKDVITGDLPNISEFATIKDFSTYSKSRIKYTVKNLINYKK